MASPTRTCGASNMTGPPTAARLKQWMAPGQDLHVRQFVALRITWLVTFHARTDSTTEPKIAELLPPARQSWVWNRRRRWWRIVTRSRSFLRKHGAQNPDRTVRAVAMAFSVSMAQLRGDSAALAARYSLLQQEYNDVPEVQYYLKSLNPGRRIAKGKVVPDFAVQLLRTSLASTAS